MKNSTYSNSLAVALEKYFLGNDRINRMTESSPKEALGILSEVDFGDGVEISSPLEFELLLNAEENKLFAFIKEYCTSDAFKEFFITENDFYNAQAFIRAKYLKIDPQLMTRTDGLYSKDEMKEKIFADEYGEFPKELQAALLEADGLFVEKKATGANIDGVFKKALYKRLYAISLKDADLKNLYRIKADFINVSLSLRKNFDDVKDDLLVGGSLSEDVLKSVSEGTVKPELLRKNKEEADVLSYAFKEKEENGALSGFEKRSDDKIMEYLLKKKYSSEKIYPFMLYCYYKKREIENVRIIMVGLINGLSESEIKGRLRKFYEW